MCMNKYTHKVYSVEFTIQALHINKKISYENFSYRLLYSIATYVSLHIHIRTYSRVQNKVNVVYCNYCVITDRSTNCNLPLALSV